MIDRDFWSGRRVFVTGHTGFKGGWLSLLLQHLGAKVFGFAKPAECGRGIFSATRARDNMTHIEGDVRCLEDLHAAIALAQPSVIVHMSAQSLVRRSYLDPVETYSTNVMGTVHVLEAARRVSGVDAVVVVTSDKCYENRGWVWGYRETDALGGFDPYSNSKGCAELVTCAFRSSFSKDGSLPPTGSARAGNVIGGGDWAPDRLVPDAIRAFMAGDVLTLRHPSAIRPWQHVLDPLTGYLTLAQQLAKRIPGATQAWNFGPSIESEVPVQRVVEGLVQFWGAGAGWTADHAPHPHEAATLRLDCARARHELGWNPRIDLNLALKLTVDWYAAQRDGLDMHDFTVSQIRSAI